LRRLVVIAHRSGMNPTDISTAVGIARQRVYKILDAER
jgi:sugar-specific transcriptional regulator TrmB